MTSKLYNDFVIIVFALFLLLILIMSKGLLLKSSGIVKSASVKLVGNYLELFKQGFVVGIGWSMGVTFGFVVISSIIVFVLNSLGGLPFIGSWIADIVEVTKDQLVRRSVISPIR